MDRLGLCRKHYYQSRDVKKPECNWDDCHREQYAKGVCSRHYQQLKKNNGKFRRNPTVEVDMKRAPYFSDQAACWGKETAMFFELPSLAARHICKNCPVRLKCLEWSLENPVQEYGTFGGVDEVSRKRWVQEGLEPMQMMTLSDQDLA